jgi:hypothetical protein
MDTGAIEIITNVACHAHDISPSTPAETLDLILPRWRLCMTLRAASGTSRNAPVGCSNDLVVAPEMQHNIRALRQHTEAAAFDTRDKVWCLIPV